MSILKRILAVPIFLILYLSVFLTTAAGHLISTILSWIAGLAGICSIWAWLIGDKMALIFLGIFCLFTILVALVQILTEKSFVFAAWISRMIQSNQ